MSQPVLVQGAGSWGTALALVLARNNHQVYLWDIDSDVIEDIKLRRHNARYLPEIEIPKNIYPIIKCEEIPPEIKKVISAVPSHALRSSLSFLKTLDISSISMSDITPATFRGNITPDNTKKAGISLSYSDYSRKIKLSVNRSLSGLTGSIPIFRMKAKVKPPLLFPIVIWPWMISGNYNNTTNTDSSTLTTSYVTSNNSDGKYHLDIDFD